jgi:hypothetical protein
MRLTRRRSLVVVLPLLGILLAVLVFLRRETPRSSSSAAAASGVETRTGRMMPIGDLVGFAFDWLGQPGVRGHRIAGRVTHRGMPVAKAKTRLVTEELRVGEWILAEVATDETGRFDFGARPATRFRVVAQAEGLVASGLAVDLRAPDLRPAPDALEIELRDCTLVVSGTVRDAAGGLIAQAHMRAGSFAEEFGGTVSDAEGRYHLCLSAGPVHIEASADGYGTALEHRQGRRELRVDFALSPEVVIAGRVVDESGAPAPGVAVAAETNGHEPGRVVDSDNDGRFRLEGLALGSYLVSARDDGRAAEKKVMARTAGETVEVELGLETRAVLTGRVVVAGQAESGATVRIKDGDDRVTLATAVSQRDGRFSMSGLPITGKVHVEVEGHKLVAPAKVVDLSATRDVELVCERLAKVSGHVMRNGMPVARAQVRLNTSQRPQRILSEADGKFVIEGVEPGTHELLAESIVEGAMMTHRTLTVGTRDVEDLILELDLAGSISGLVVDTTGAPVAGVYVVFNNRADDFGNDVSAADGSFTATGLAGGSDYYPTVYAPGSVTMTIPPAEGGTFPAVHVADGKSHVTGVRLVVVGDDDFSISGKVVRGGEPVVGATIVAQGIQGRASAQTGADGTFVITGVASGGYEVGVSRDGRFGRLQGAVMAKAGDKDVRIELPAVGSIEGELVGFSGTKRVFARGEKGFFTSIDVTDNHFSITDLAVDTYTVSATSTDGAHDQGQVAVVAKGVASVSLKGGPTGHIEGTVSDWRTGAPVEGAICRWSRAGIPGNTSQGGSDAAGHFSLDVPAETIDVICLGPKGPSAAARDVQVDVPPGGSASVTVQLVMMRNTDERAHLQLSITGDPPRVHYVDGNAKSAGLLVGDVVVSVSGTDVKGLSRGAVEMLIRDQLSGQPTNFVVDRAGAQLSFDVVPDVPILGVDGIVTYPK